MLSRLDRIIEEVLYMNLLKEQVNGTAEIKRKQNFIHNCL